MKARLARYAMVLAVGTLIMTGCEVLPEELPTPTPIPTPSSSRKPTYEVKRGSVVNVIKSLGRVAAVREETYFFRQAGRLKAIYVSYGQQVKEGDLLAELDTGLLDTQIAQAQVDVDVAALRVAAQKAAKPELAGLKRSEAAVAGAEANLESARARLAELKAGPTQAEIKAAEAALARAQENLSAAQHRLTSLITGPKPEDIRAAQLNLEQARNALWATQIERDGIKGSVSSSKAQKEAADARVAAAETAVSVAQSRLDALMTPPSAEDIKVAEDSVASAQAALASAEANLSATRAGASAADIAAAEKAVESAEQALASAQVSLESQRDKVNPVTNYDLLILEKQHERAKLSLQALELQAAEARIVAPFDGVVISTSGRAGDLVQAYQQIVSLADPRGLEVRVDLTPVDVTRCAVGQEVLLTIDAYPGKQLKGRIEQLPTFEPGATGAAAKQSVRISYEAPGPGAKLDNLANVTIIVDRRDDVLIVPNSVIRTFGERVFVQIQDEDRRREVDVKIGLKGEEFVEIQSGLKEGQVVIAR